MRCRERRSIKASRRSKGSPQGTPGSRADRLHGARKLCQLPAQTCTSQDVCLSAEQSDNRNLGELHRAGKRHQHQVGSTARAQSPAQTPREGAGRTGTCHGTDRQVHQTTGTDREMAVSHRGTSAPQDTSLPRRPAHPSAAAGERRQVNHGGDGVLGGGAQAEQPDAT